MNPWFQTENLTDKKLISPKELTELLNVSMATVYRLVNARQLPAYKVGNSLRFAREDVIEYLNTNRIDQVEM